MSPESTPPSWAAFRVDLQSPFAQTLFNDQAQTGFHNEFSMVGGNPNPETAHSPWHTDGPLISGFLSNETLNTQLPSFSFHQAALGQADFSNGQLGSPFHSQPMTTAPPPAPPAIHHFPPVPSLTRRNHSNQTLLPPSLFQEATLGQAQISNGQLDQPFNSQPMTPTPSPAPPAFPHLSPSTRKTTIRRPQSQRHALIAGVQARRRARPLPEVTVLDPNNEKDVKRARNTESARRSREKKVKHLEEMAAMIEELEQKNRDLETERDYWRLEAQNIGPSRS
jgi:hypothetical protein